MFNAPLHQTDHAERAVRCAVELDEYCERFAARSREHGLDFGRTRIGVITGTVVVGNMGGSGRFDYTATGEAINIAARLENANRHLGTRVCVSSATTKKVREVRFHPVAHLVLKELSEAVEAWEPIDPNSMDQEYEQAYLDAYCSVAAGDANAIEQFSRLAERVPDDGVVAFHARRLSDGESGVRVIIQEK